MTVLSLEGLGRTAISNAKFRSPAAPDVFRINRIKARITESTGTGEDREILDGIAEENEARSVQQTQKFASRSGGRSTAEDNQHTPLFPTISTSDPGLSLVRRRISRQQWPRFSN